MSLKKNIKVFFLTAITLLVLNYFFAGVKLHLFKPDTLAYEDYLSKYAQRVTGDDGKERKLIILAMTDQSFADMAINLYESSFKRFNIDNYLFVGVGKFSCEVLHSKNIHCFHFSEVANSNSSSMYQTSEFIQKVRLRSDFILGALYAGFTVLHTDIDIVFLRNPMPDIQNYLSKYDMMTLWDYIEHNSGFLFINPTNYTRYVYSKMKNEIFPDKKYSDQRALNLVLNRDKNLKSKLVGRLSENKYLSGNSYFELTDRNFPAMNKSFDNCLGCLVVHNNWVVSKEAKRYRFKEALMWWVDEQQYYSSQTNKYISYANPFISQSINTDELEINALKSAFAISKILDRILILPRFHCHASNRKVECSLLNYLSIRDLDKNFFTQYRESSFLLHHLVPDDLKVFEPFYRKRYSLGALDIPETYTIKTKLSMQFLESFDHHQSTLLNFSTKNVIEENSILETLGKNKNNLIHLTSLLAVEVSFQKTSFQTEFDGLLNASFVRKKYMQF